ncbi:unnamed protein product [Rodentolepis nana]|uniref:Uncharacterized protein n=1 Tax=Rodentolepis nana TaxID=102285 RepID=A0A0R3U089_RODNA|nr:unnamed protein product [Rodentolepis nana]
MYPEYAQYVADEDIPRSRGPGMHTSPLETEMYYRNALTTTGYGTPLVQPTGSSTAELRGRIRRLICRTRKNPHHFRYLPSSYAEI